jgi:gamma-glutamyltranspeptidase / glutathione hydrolase
MRGAIAAGHPLTAEAGARVLAEGGSAVDACLAAAFVSWVVESPVTGPGGGGFMLVHRARDRSSRLIDFFVTTPGLGLRTPPAGEMEEIDVEFVESSQVFRIGAASCAVPGAPAGLEYVHRLYGTRPWQSLIEPALDLARTGVALTRPQAHLHAVVDLILRHGEEGQAIFGPEGRRLVAGERLVQRDLAHTLELLSEHGSRAIYGGEVARAIASHVQELGGAITLRDLEEYRVIRRRPVQAAFGGHELESNPPPSTGGVLIGYGLRMIDRLGPGGKPGSAEAIARLVEIMREQNRVRSARFGRDLRRGGLTRRLYDDQQLADAVERVGGTTQISVVDAEGNAASCTASTGSGSGVVVPGTGIHLNNMLGEFDLAGAAGTGRPGTRMTSMMAPSVVMRDGAPRLVVGSAGSVRLRGVIMQIVIDVAVHGMAVGEAIDFPRFHLEDEDVHCEGGADPAELDRLEAMGYRLVRWRRRNLYFGGAQAVEIRPDGSLAAAGDPRRGGAGLVVG